MKIDTEEMIRLLIHSKSSRNREMAKKLFIDSNWEEIQQFKKPGTVIRFDKDRGEWIIIDVPKETLS